MTYIETLALASNRMSLQLFDELGGMWSKRAFYCLGLSRMDFEESRWLWLKSKAFKVLVDNGYVIRRFNGVANAIVGEQINKGEV